MNELLSERQEKMTGQSFKTGIQSQAAPGRGDRSGGAHQARNSGLALFFIWNRQPGELVRIGQVTRISGHGDHYLVSDQTGQDVQQDIGSGPVGIKKPKPVVSAWERLIDPSWW